MIPSVKKRVLKSGELVFEKLYVCGDEEIVAFAKTYLGYFLPIETITCTKSQANIIFHSDKNISSNGYIVRIGKRVEIYYKDYESVRNALATVIQLINRQSNGKYAIPCQTIKDYSDCSYRSVMIDLARGLPDLQRLKKDIKILSLAKCNKLHLHLADSLGLCYESSVFSYTEDIRGTKRYSKQTLKELVEYCKTLAIEIIPEIEIPAHATQLLEVKPQLRCEMEEENTSLWTICAGTEKTYEVFQELIAEICEIFPSEYIHIGGDEHYFSDIPDLNRKRYWSQCSVCRKRMQDENLSDETELFYYLIRRMQDILAKFGKKAIIWNDMIDISKPVNIRKDCIIQFWRIANEHRGPRKDCSYEKFLEQGFKLICSPFEICYVNREEYANLEKTASFDYREYGNGAAYKEKVIGCEACAWDYGNPKFTHYLHSFLPSTVLLLEKMWNGENVIYNKEYRQKLTKLLCLDAPQGYDVFELYGSIMPPRISGQISYVSLENEMMDLETLNKHKEILNKISNIELPVKEYIEEQIK